MSSLFALSTQKAEVRKRPRPVDNRQRWLALAPFIKKRFKTDMGVKEIAAELAYQEYLQQKKKDEMFKQFIEVIG